jgi:ATP-dependent Clp protease ATP-binding subunit ClpA
MRRQLVSEQLPNAGEEKKTVAIRVSPGLRGRLDSVLQITGISVNDAGIEAFEDWTAKKLSDPQVRDKALASLDEEERTLKARREALQGLIGDGDAAASDKPSTTTRNRGKSS